MADFFKCDNVVRGKVKKSVLRIISFRNINKEGKSPKTLPILNNCIILLNLIESNNNRVYPAGISSWHELRKRSQRTIELPPGNGWK
jgi:hypothetical protein